MKSLGLALGSGGARGVAHIGFLQALEDKKIKPQFISGCSMGSVVGSCYAFGMRPKDMLDAVLSLRIRDLVDPDLKALRSGTLLKSKKLLAVLRRFLGHTKFDELSVPFSCIGADLLTGKKVVFSEGEVAPAVQASSSIPLVFQPVNVNGMMIADGGVVCRVPSDEVKELGAEVVVAVDVLGPLREMNEIRSVIGYLIRLVDIYDNQNTENNRKNSHADIYVSPDLGSMSPYKIERKNFEMAYKNGYECGLSVTDKIKELIK